MWHPCQQAGAIAGKAQRFVERGGRDRAQVGVFPGLDAAARKPGAAERFGGGIAGGAVAWQTVAQACVTREEAVGAGQCRGGHCHASRRRPVAAGSKSNFNTEAERRATEGHRSRSVPRCRGGTRPPWRSVALRVSSVIKCLRSRPGAPAPRSSQPRRITTSITRLLPPSRRSRALPVRAPDPGRRSARYARRTAHTPDPARCDRASAGGA